MKSSEIDSFQTRRANTLTRRALLSGSTVGLGAFALNSLLGAEAKGSEVWI